MSHFRGLKIIAQKIDLYTFRLYLRYRIFYTPYIFSSIQLLWGTAGNFETIFTSYYMKRPTYYDECMKNPILNAACLPIVIIVLLSSKKH